MNVESRSPNKISRRLLITDGKQDRKLLTFTQGKDGSVYVSAPSPHDCKWLEVTQSDPPRLRVANIPAAGKLSIHGSGVAHVRPGDGGEVELRLAGNYLMSEQRRELGVRHLVTVLPTEPVELPIARRASDCSLRCEELRPQVLVFWAIPCTRKLQFRVAAGFQVNDLENQTPEIRFGAMNLRTHAVLWFAYRTKHMQRWPARNHFSFHDGYHVPMLIGEGEGRARLELRKPTYQLNDDHIGIQL